MSDNWKAHRPANDAYKENYNAIDWSGTRRTQKKRVEKKRLFSVIPDINEFVSPIDGSVISSRSTLRYHEKKYQVRQCGNDWTGSERPANWPN